MKTIWTIKHLLMIFGILGLFTFATPKTAAAQSDPFIGTIAMFGFNFCPRGWTGAEGQLLAISQNTALFSLYGTTYGGDGRTTFALPDLRGRNPIGDGTGPGLPQFRLGQRGGAVQTTLSVQNMPSHNHPVNATNSIADKTGPGTDFLAADVVGGDPIYHNGPANRVMDPEMIGNTGGSQPFSIQDPYLTIKFCVALQGIFPSRN